MGLLKLGRHRFLFVAAALHFSVVLCGPAAAAIEVAEASKEQLTGAIAEAIGNGKWHKVLRLSGELRALGGTPPASLDYVEGKALLRTGKPQAAVAKFDAYIRNAGADGSFYDEARAARAEAEQAFIAKWPSRRWVAKARSSGLLIREVDVIAQKMPYTYLMTVSGRYPTKYGEKELAPAVLIRTWAIRWNNAIGTKLPDSTATYLGRWDPGQEFSFSTHIPHRYIHGPIRTSLEFCVGTKAVCVNGPSYGPKR